MDYLYHIDFYIICFCAISEYFLIFRWQNRIKMYSKLLYLTTCLREACPQNHLARTWLQFISISGFFLIQNLRIL